MRTVLTLHDLLEWSDLDRLGEPLEIMTAGYHDWESPEALFGRSVDVEAPVINVQRRPNAARGEWADQERLGALAWNVGAQYASEVSLGPPWELITAARAGMVWEEFGRRYRDHLRLLPALDHLALIVTRWRRVILLCAEPARQHCHRHLLARALRRRVRSATILELAVRGPQQTLDAFF
jgi:uncharacterized protein (DUF488 family)